MAVITKGIELYLQAGAGGDNGFSSVDEKYKVAEKGTLMYGLQEIGDLSQVEGSGRDKIEITTLADDKHVYTDGILADSGNDGIEFKFLFDAKLYKGFVEQSKSEKSQGLPSTWGLYIPVGVTNVGNQSQTTYCKFTIKAMCSVSVDGAGVNSAMTMTVTLSPTEVIQFEDILVKGGAL